MVRINLVAVTRERAKKPSTIRSIGANQKVTIGCTLILLLAGAFCGWRYWLVTRLSHEVDRQILSAQQETSRLHAVIMQVQQFEQRKAQLQQRVVLIEQLRKSQRGPVYMLDQVSRSLPSMLWLTELKQVGPDVVIDGRCTNLTGLSDFVANLEGTGYFKRSIEIVSTQTEAIAGPPGELIKFSIRAQFLGPGEPGPAASAPGGGRAGGAAPAGGGRAGAAKAGG